MNGLEVTLIFPGETINERLFPRELGLFLNAYYAGKGVRVLARHSVSGLDRMAGNLAVALSALAEHAGPFPEAGIELESEIEVDAVIAGLGIEPNVELAQQAGLSVENGIVVDERLRTDQPDIFAAGDVASFFSSALNRRLRVEHEDNANTMGRMAGINMAGRAEPYRHLPAFYSDLFDLGYEAVGEPDPRLEVVQDWKEPNREGVLYYLKEGRVRGVVLWNVWNQVGAARDLIAEPGPFRPEDLKGRLPR